MVLPEINTFHTPSLIRGINDKLSDSGYSLIVFQSDDSFTKEKEIINQCFSWAVEGVLISLAHSTTTVDHLRELQDGNIHCIQVDKVIPNPFLSTVTIDNRLAGYQATAYLLERGHRNILGIFGNPNLTITRERMLGFRQAFADHQTELREEQLLVVDNSQQLQSILPLLLRAPLAYTGIFTMSDELLFQSFYLIQQSQRKIPDEISLIAISDGILAHHLYPAITHIQDAGYQLGQQATTLLLQHLRQRPNHSLAQLLEAPIVRLDSVRSL